MNKQTHEKGSFMESVSKAMTKHPKKVVTMPGETLRVLEGKPPEVQAKADQEISELELLQVGCSKSLEDGKPADTNFVCDTTNPWLHFDGKSWAAATPPLGCHTYIYLKGAVPQGCTVGAACSACRSPQGKRLKTVTVKAGSCGSC